jgi:hypothetical protein
MLTSNPASRPSARDLLQTPWLRAAAKAERVAAGVAREASSAATDIMSVADSTAGSIGPVLRGTRERLRAFVAPSVSPAAAAARKHLLGLAAPALDAPVSIPHVDPSCDSNTTTADAALKIQSIIRGKAERKRTEQKKKETAKKESASPPRPAVPGPPTAKAEELVAVELDV